MLWYDVVTRPNVKKAVFFIVVPLVLLLVGCAGTYKPTYHRSIIQKQSESQPVHDWVYPSYEKLKQVPMQAGLNGVERPRPLPAFVPDREPAYVVSMNLLSDGSLVCVSPIEYAYESKRFTIATYHRERITRVKVIRFDGKNGSHLWSQILSAEGVYDVTEMDAVLLFSSNNFDKNGKFIETNLVALDKSNGSIRWRREFTRPFRYFSISQGHNLVVFSTKSNDQGTARESVEAVDVTTGKSRWSVQLASEGSEASKKNSWPTIVAGDILLFEDGVSLRHLRDEGVVWSRKDIKTAGVAQPLVFGNTVWFQSESGIMALDVATGNTKWTCKTITDELIKIAFSGKHLYASSSKKGPGATTHSLAMIDLSSGEVRWQIETDPLLGNIVEDQRHVHISTATHLVTLSITDGSTVRRSKLPWQDEFSHHVLTLRGDTLTVKNEWNVAMWKVVDHKLVYHHPFEPLCPIMTTRDRMLEQRKLGRSVSSATVNASSYNYAVNTAYFSSQFNQAMSNYRSTGDTTYLASAEASYGLTQNAMAQNRALAGMQFGMAMSSATLQIGTAVIKHKVQVTSSMIYPQIDAVMKKHRIFDNGDYVVRLVGVQVGKQRFSALHVVHEPTGRSRQVLLSPSQMPANLTTFARSPMTAQELNGYYSAAMYLGHCYSTVADLKRGCIFHYGPGLTVGEYVTYGNTAFVRGRLWRFDMELPSY
jgi:outer membrane protein assembly factor BamB